jgi:hypothetical protein
MQAGGFERKDGGKKGYNIIVVSRKHKGLKRRFDTLGLI